MTRFPRRATIAAALLIVPLTFGLATSGGPQAVAGATRVLVAEVAPVVQADLVQANVVHAALSGKKKVKKPKKTPTAKKAPAKQPPTTKAPTAKLVESVPTTVESQVVALINTYRAAHGCGALRVDNRLVTAARVHSTDMVASNYFDHAGADGSTFITRELAAGYPTGGPSAENIAWGYHTAQDVVTGWINSDGHRANILNCSSVAVGVGLAVKADGTPYWTQDFGRV